MRKAILFILPLLVFTPLVYLFIQALENNTRVLPSTLIGKPVPDIPYSKGQVSLLHVWASWCLTCRAEHTLLMKLHQQGIPIIAIDYKDPSNQASIWLRNQGNPYTRSIDDKDGHIAIDLGVYGTPETFIVDQQGIIRDKYIGEITPEVWRERLMPKIQSLRARR